MVWAGGRTRVTWVMSWRAASMMRLDVRGGSTIIPEEDVGC
jgi:hypothetical protein